MNDEGINLSRFERQILANQYLILSTIRPDEEEYYYNLSEIAKNGYKREYYRLVDVSEDEMSDERGDEVYEVLGMFRQLEAYIEQLAPGDRSFDRLKFRGFDSHEERGQHFFFAHFLIKDDGKFEEFKDRKLDSHGTPTMQFGYRPLLKAYKELTAEDRVLTKEDLEVLNKIMKR